MAKKKKSKARAKHRNKEVEVEHELPGGFWRQVGAVLMIAIAVVLVATWFSSGDTVFAEIHKVAISTAKN